MLHSYSLFIPNLTSQSFHRVFIHQRQRGIWEEVEAVYSSEIGKKVLKSSQIFWGLVQNKGEMGVMFQTIQNDKKC